MKKTQTLLIEQSKTGSSKRDKMITQAIKFRTPIYVAVSGGVDSMVAASLLLQKKVDIQVLHFNHQTTHGHKAEAFVRGWCAVRGLTFHCDTFTGNKVDENSWRTARYEFFNRFTNRPVITCHHLDDAVEWWLFTAIKGNPRLMPPVNGNYRKPFMLTPKSEFIDFANRKGVEWLEDETNAEVVHTRNYIRHVLRPAAEVVNPGLATTIKKKLLIEYDRLRSLA